MKKLFVPSYELSLALGELGFDEECLGCYYQAIEHVDRDYYKREDVVYNEGSPIYFTTGKYYKNEKYSKFLVGVPTWEQAFDWLLDKYKYWQFTFPNIHSKDWSYHIQYYDVNDGWGETFYKGGFENQEQARLECLKKLIEIVEN